MPSILDSSYQSNANDNQHVLDIYLTMSKASTTPPPTHSTSQFPLDMFSPIVKPTTIHIILSLTLSKWWPLQQLDVNNVFLHRHLSKDFYMVQPLGFIDQNFPNHMCHLHKALYGLKQAPRAWYTELRLFLVAIGFVNSHLGTSLFVYHTKDLVFYLLVYVDDLILIGNDLGFINKFVYQLATQSSIKDLSSLSFFLGVEVIPFEDGFFLSQHKYITKLLTWTNMMNAKEVQMPFSPTQNLTLFDDTSLIDPIEYQQVVW